MKKLTLIIVVILMAVLLIACSENDEKAANGKNKDEIVLKFSHVGSPSSIKGVAADKFAELVAEKTDNRVTVQVFHSSQLYGDQDELDALLSGNVQMIAPSVSKLVKLDPRWQFADMPYLFKDTAHLHKFFESEAAEKLLRSDQLLNNGIEGLAYWENGFKNFSNNKGVLKSPLDFKSMTFRAQAGQVLESQFRSLGAGSTTVAWGETYSALQQGVADGAEATPNMMDTTSFQEVQKHLTVSEHGRVDYVVLVNSNFWNNIPEDLREKVSEAMIEATKFEWGIAAEYNQESLANLEADGMTITKLSEEERNNLKETLQTVYEEFGSVITKELLDAIHDLE